MTLLEKARNSTGRKAIKIGPQQIELALGWARGEYGIGAVNDAVESERGGAGVYCLIARSLREAIAQGRLVDKREPRREYP